MVLCRERTRKGSAWVLQLQRAVGTDRRSFKGVSVQHTLVLVELVPLVRHKP